MKLTRKEVDENNAHFQRINAAACWRLWDYFESRPDWQKVEGAVFGLKDFNDRSCLGSYGTVVSLEDGSTTFLIQEVQ